MADQVLQDIKDRLDIIEVIGSYITLKKSGANYKASCPFHNEKSASLMVSAPKQIWHCFGCGEGGDIFGFVMRYENIEFRDSLKLLAQRAGVELPQYNRAAKDATPDESEALIRINDFAARFYHQSLLSPHGKTALDYLHSRGLTDGTIADWGIGFAPDDFHLLESALKQKGVTLEQMVRAGVSVKNDRGQMYDRFRNRITFPIKDYYGNVVGFTARILDDDTGQAQQAKYVNSPETPIYNKSKVLFGLHAAKEAIRKADEVVVVEGQMDVIMPHQAGFTNTVASSGTALTEQQLKQLGRLTKNIKFCFDADSAGLQATRRAGEIALQQGLRLKIIVLTDVKDPDELIRKGSGLWEKAVKEAVWFIDYYINRAANLHPSGSVEQKHYLSETVLPLLGYITDPVEQDHYVHSLSTDFLISEKVIRDELKKTASAQLAGVTSAQTSEAQFAQADPATRAQLSLEKQVLGGLLFSPEYVKFAQEQGLGDEMENPTLKQLANAALLGELDQSAVNGEVLAKEALFMVESQLDNLDNNELALMRELEKSLFLLKLASIKRRQQELTLEIKKLEKQNDNLGVEQLTKIFAELVGQRSNIEAQLAQ